MEEIVLRKIGFGSYIKIFLLSGIGIGICIGILMLVLGLLGAPITATIGNTVYSGVTAGLLSLPMGVVAGAFIFGWFSLITFPVFKLFLKLSNGIKIKVMVRAQADPGIDDGNIKISVD